MKECEWQYLIMGLREQAKITQRKTRPALKRALKAAIATSIQKNVQESTAILLSGGVDSSYLLMKALNIRPVKAFAVGFGEASDVQYAKKAAEILGAELEVIQLTEEKLEQLFREVAQILCAQEPNVLNPITLTMGALVAAVSERAKEQGFKILLSGLGSEEIFAGYQRHKESEDINEECWNGLASMWKRDFVRDYSITKHYGLEYIMPFLEPNLISIAMQFSEEDKIHNGVQKVILREIAREEGLDEEFASRPKKAGQYGSRIDKFLQSIAKKKGFKRKSAYVESLRC